MATFYQFQRVRILRTFCHPEAHGMECVLLKRVDFTARIFGRFRILPGWETDLMPLGEWGGLCVHEDNIEPLKYEPDAEDLATQSGSPDFTILAPLVEVRA